MNNDVKSLSLEDYRKITKVLQNDRYSEHWLRRHDPLQVGDLCLQVLK